MPVGFMGANLIGRGGGRGRTCGEKDCAQPGAYQWRGDRYCAIHFWLRHDRDVPTYDRCERHGSSCSKLS